MEHAEPFDRRSTSNDGRVAPRHLRIYEVTPSHTKIRTQGFPL